MSRVALVAGIDFYKHTTPLYGCSSDATKVAQLLEVNDYPKEGNFEVELIHASSAETAIAKPKLREKVRQIFAGENEIALFYFSGHGVVTDTGGMLICSDSLNADEGLPIDQVIAFAQKSKATNKIIVLDCCQSGGAGDVTLLGGVSVLPHGLTILASSTAEQLSFEGPDGGHFTNLFCDALSGAAANLKGDITPGSIYAHIDQSLGNIHQRPVFKTSVQRFVSLRRVTPPVPYDDLLALTRIFPDPNKPRALSPSYEPRRPIADYPDIPPPDPEKNKTFETLQRLNRVNLVVPDGAPHMFDAAMEYKGARLTDLGRHYWRLNKTKRL